MPRPGQMRGRRVLREQGVLEPAEHEDGQHHQQHGRLDEVRLGLVRPEEARRPLLVRRLVSAGPAPLADADERHDADQRRPRDGLGDPLPQREVADQREREALVHDLRVARHQGEEQHREGEHHGPVRGPHHRAALEAVVAERLVEDDAQAGAHRAPPAALRGPRPDRADDGDSPSHEHRRADQGGEDHEDEADDFQGGHQVTLAGPAGRGSRTFAPGPPAVATAPSLIRRPMHTSALGRLQTNPVTHRGRPTVVVTRARSCPHQSNTHVLPCPQGADRPPAHHRTERTC